MDLSRLIPIVKDYEHIIFVSRRHKLVFLPKILLFLILILVPWVIHFIIGLIWPEFFFESFAQPVGIIFFSGFYLFAWIFFFTNLVDYFLDVWVVTNERIIDVQQLGLFARVVAETRFYRVQDITSEVKGFFPTIFSYGNVYIQTAGEKDRFVFAQVPHPYKVAAKLMELVEADKPHHAEKIKLMKLEEGARMMEHTPGV